MNRTAIIGILVATVAMFGGGVWLLGKAAPDVALSEAARAKVGETSFDWGEIAIDGGKATHTFEVKNEGEGVLKLYEVGTSCMCTTAQVKIGDKVSPYFGMHSASGWTGEVPSGETAKVEVVFDPAYHGPSGVGEITRQVKMRTNDSQMPEIVFRLAAEVVKG